MPKHAFWKPAAEGLAFIKAHPLPLPGAAVQTWAMEFLGLKLQPQTTGGATRINTPPQLLIHPVIVTGTENQSEQAVADLR